MKIAYLFPGKWLSEKEKERREKILNKIASRDTTVHIWEIEDGPYSIEDLLDEYRALPYILKFVVENQDCYDAIIIGCAGDAGLEGAREKSRIPIVGPGESSILLGTCGDRRFSMVTISSERAAIKRRLVREAGLDINRLVSSHSLGIPVVDLYKDKKRTQRELIRCMEEAKEKGADVMILGCMSIGFMESELLHQAEKEAGLPLVNPIVTSVKMAEALISLKAY